MASDDSMGVWFQGRQCTRHNGDAGRERDHETLDSGGKRSDARQRKPEGDGDAKETKRNTTVASSHPDGKRSSTDSQAGG
jgi:hypothetical protein